MPANDERNLNLEQQLDLERDVLVELLLDIFESDCAQAEATRLAGIEQLDLGPRGPKMKTKVENIKYEPKE